MTILLDAATPDVVAALPKMTGTPSMRLQRSISARDGNGLSHGPVVVSRHSARHLLGAVAVHAGCARALIEKKSSK